MPEEVDTSLKFDTLETAEQTLTEIHRRFCECQKSHNAAGLAHCRALILKGKQRALMISKNRKVAPRKREEKAEIAQWFTVWLQTPDIFWDWLALRKASRDFQDRFCERKAEQPA